MQTNRQTDGHILCSDTFLQTNRQTDGQTVLRNYYIDWKVYKVERALASSIFELNPPKFQNYYNFGKCYNFRAGPIKQAGRNFWKILKIEQVLIRTSRLENEQIFLVRACSLNRHTRVLVFVCYSASLRFLDREFRGKEQFPKPRI